MPYIRVGNNQPSTENSDAIVSFRDTSLSRKLDNFQSPRYCIPMLPPQRHLSASAEHDWTSQYEFIDFVSCSNKMVFCRPSLSFGHELYVRTGATVRSGCTVDDLVLTGRGSRGYVTEDKQGRTGACEPEIGVVAVLLSNKSVYS